MNQIGKSCFILLFLFAHVLLIASQQCKDDKWKKWEKCGGCKKTRKRECLDDENITERKPCTIGNFDLKILSENSCESMHLFI